MEIVVHYSRPGTGGVLLLSVTLVEAKPYLTGLKLPDCAHAVLIILETDGKTDSTNPGTRLINAAPLRVSMWPSAPRVCQHRPGGAPPGSAPSAGATGYDELADREEHS